MSLFVVPMKPHRGLIYLLLALAETAWLVPWLLVLTLQSAPASLFPTLFVIVFLAILLGWLTDAYGMPPELMRVAGLGLVFVGILALVRLIFYPNTGLLSLGWVGDFLGALITNPVGIGGVLVWVLLAMGYVWWRCLDIGQVPPVLDVAKGTLLTGLLGFAILLIISVSRVVEIPFGLIILFSVCSLLAVSLSYTQTIAAQHGDAAIGGLRLRIVNGGLILGLVAIVALLLTTIFSMSTIGWLFQIVFTVIEAFLSLISLALIWILSVIGPAFDALALWLQSLAVEPVAIEMEGDFSGTPEPIEEESVELAPAWWLPYLLMGWRVLIILLVVWLFYRLLQRLGRLRETQPPAAASSQASATAEMPSLKDLWQSGRERLGDLTGLVRRFGVGQDLRAVVTIRRIYAALLILAEQHQLQREPAQTPTEFLEPLTDRWPTLAAQFNSITEAYINVHYGELPEVQETAAQVQQAWESVYTSISRGESNRNEAHQGAK